VDIESRKQYLDQVWKKYQSADGRTRSQLLDEAQKRTGLNRKYLIRMLGRAAPERRRGAAEVTALIQMWDVFEQPCGQRLAAVLGHELDRLRQQGELRCSDSGRETGAHVREHDRPPVAAREDRPASEARSQPGHALAALPKDPGEGGGGLGHQRGGESAGGFCGALWPFDGRRLHPHLIGRRHCHAMVGGPGHRSTVSARDQRRTDGHAGRFPFRIRELHPDNDSALINDLLWSWCQQERIRMSRSRPYKKNDNAWVEQKNWTHVRKVVGYRRYDQMAELKLLNEIYGVLLYKNFFLPVIKLKSKTRIGGRIRRVYEAPRTPYERVLKSRGISRKTKQQLRSVYESLNAAALHRRLLQLRDELDRVNGAKPELVIKPAPRGYGIQLRKRTAVGSVEARGLGPEPRGGCAPATCAGKPNLSMKANTASISLPLVGPETVHVVEVVTRAHGLHSYLTIRDPSG
jgi:hypothetical protein